MKDDRKISGHKKRKWLETSSSKERPSDKPQDLQSFLHVSKEREQNTASTYFVGTKFEFQVLDLFKGYRFVLKRRGAAYDEGLVHCQEF